MNCAKYDLRPYVTNNERITFARQLSRIFPLLDRVLYKWRDNREIFGTPKVYFYLYVQIFNSNALLFDIT